MKNFPIKVKLILLIFPLFILLNIAIATLSVRTNSVYLRTENIYYDKLYNINNNLSTADADLHKAALARNNLIISNSNNGISSSDITSYIDTYETNTKNVLSKLNAAADIAKKDAVLWKKTKNSNGENYETIMSDLINRYNELINQYDISQYKNISDESNASWVNCFDSTRSDLEKLQEITNLWAINEKKGLQSKITMYITSIAAPLTIIAILILITVFFISFRLSNDIKSVTNNISTLATNDLTNTPPVVNGNDEINKMKQAFNTLSENLIGIVSTLQNTSVSLSTACDNLKKDTKETDISIVSIKNAASELASNSVDAARNVESISSNMIVLNEIMQNSTSTAKSLTKLSLNIQDVTHQGTNTIDELTNINTKSQEAFNEIFDAIESIYKSTENIGTASNLISNIAVQTNLLSLNASIEAARAGEAGKGFAVVAEEIRTLSDESAKNVNIIDEMLNELQNNTKTALEKSDLVREYVRRQNISVHRTKGSFSDIVESVDNINQSISVIESINSELAGKIVAITDSISNLSSISQENAATAQELSATSDLVGENVTNLHSTENQVNSSADKLINIISEFKI